MTTRRDASRAAGRTVGDARGAALVEAVQARIAPAPYGVGVHDTADTLEMPDPFRRPREVTAAFVLILCGMWLAFIAGASSGLTWSQAAWMAADGIGFTFPASSERALLIAFLHNLVWFPLRCVVAFKVRKGRTSARITGMVAEAAAIAVWVPVLFVSFEGHFWHIEDTGIEATKGLAIACICLSVATFAMLSMKTVAAWCKDRQAEDRVDHYA